MPGDSTNSEIVAAQNERHKNWTTRQTRCGACLWFCFILLDMIASQIRVAASEHVRVGLSFLGHLFFPSVSPAPALWFGADAHLCWLFRMNADRRCRVMHVCLFSVWLCQSEYLKLNASGNNVQRPRKKNAQATWCMFYRCPLGTN